MLQEAMTRLMVVPAMIRYMAKPEMTPCMEMTAMILFPADREMTVWLVAMGMTVIYGIWATVWIR